MGLVIGTSGWQYRHWRGRLYPDGVPVREWLPFYAERFRTVESNNAFYRLPEREIFVRWADQTPDDFVFSVKVSRFLTHIKRLREPEEPVARFADRVGGLGEKLGPALLQLPPNLKAEPELLDRVLALFPRWMRVAVEFRHPTWFTREVRSILERRSAALCLADGTLARDTARSKPVSPLWRTADWGYVRFHHGAATPDPCYGRTALASWVRRIEETHGRDAEVFVYFNNDHRGCAPANARTFAAIAQRAGFRVTRTPREVISIDHG